MRSGRMFTGSAAGRRTRTVALITVMAMVFSCLLIYYEDDINYAVSGLSAPALKKLNYTQTKTGYKAVLTWQAKKGRIYQVLRKTTSTGKYKVLAKVKATSATGSYTDKKIGKDKTFTYTVRRILVSGSKITDTGKYDSEGLTTIATPTVKVDFTNMKADISWKKVSGTSKYLIYRKVGKSDQYYKIKAVASKQKAYSDYYYYASYEDKSKEFSKKLAAISLKSHFVDASNNPLSYTVRGYYAKTVNLVKKESYGLYLPDGEFRLETPSIISLSNDGTLVWGTVANADSYRIYSSPDGSDWKKIADQKHTGSDYIPSSGAKDTDVSQQYKIPDFDSDLYYTVRAFATKNGSTVKSQCDTGFTIKNRKYNERILCVGDSISFGSPYRGKEWKKFSYQSRIQQLTGATFFNPSIPGSTYHYGLNDSAESEEDGESSTSKLVTGVVQMMVEDAYNGTGKHHNTDKMSSTRVGVNNTYLYDYDVVMLAGGTNDYLHYDKNSFKFGSNEIDWDKIKDKDKTKGLTFTVNSGTSVAEKFTSQNYDYNIQTFDGAYNQILKWIEGASIYRVQHGKKPIQVVAMNMFYSDRTNYTVNGKSHYPITNRNTTQNSLGYTLKDYQSQLDTLNSKWASVAAFKLYQYDTQGAGIVNKSTCPYATADNLHLTKYSYAQYGNSLSSFMMKYFMDKEKDIDPNSKEFLDRAAKHGMLSERMSYLEGEAGAGIMLQSIPDEEPDPAVEEMKAYIRLLYEYGYLDQMLDECSPEDRERYEQFIEFYGLLDEAPESEPLVEPSEDEYADSAENDAAEDSDDPAYDHDYGYDQPDVNDADDAVNTGSSDKGSGTDNSRETAVSEDDKEKEAGEEDGSGGGEDDAVDESVSGGDTGGE